MVTVADRGPGITDPFVGLLAPGSNELGGRGLWIASQFCDELSFRRTRGGFEVRLTVHRDFHTPVA